MNKPIHEFCAVDEMLPSQPKTKRRTTARRRRQPRFQVVLWDDDDHSYQYVVRMMRDLFGFDSTKGYQIARAVDGSGKAVCLTTTREHAELKRDQIHAYGSDKLIPRCVGSMWATIEAVP